MPCLRHALVLTAGLGTRLRPLTEVRAKPAIPVAGVPMVRRIVSWLAGQGVGDIVLNLHHLPHTITAVVGDGSDLFTRVRYSWEHPVVLGSAGGPRQALSIVGADVFLIVNGDVLTDFDLNALCQAHVDSGALVTLALVRNREPHRYGGVRLDAEGNVAGFPPPGAAAEEVFHFVGVQVAHADAFRPLGIGQPAASVRGIYDDLITQRPGSIRGFVGDAAFWDVGTVSDYWRTSWSLADGADGSTAMRGDRVDIAPTARVSRSIFWDDVVVPHDCVLDECIVTDGVLIPSGSRFRQTIVMRGADGANRTVRFQP